MITSQSQKRKDNLACLTDPISDLFFFRTTYSTNIFPPVLENLRLKSFSPPVPSEAESALERVFVRPSDSLRVHFPMFDRTLYQSVHLSLIHIYTHISLTHSYTHNILKKKQLVTVKVQTKIQNI